MGQASDLYALKRLCAKHNLLLIEDAAHALGTRYCGRMVGGIADITTLSFHPVKTVAAGEGGAVLTNDSELFEKARLFRVHGITRDREKLLHMENGNWYYEQQALGFNYRITDMQAALCCSQMRKLKMFSKRRKELVELYNREFSGMEDIMLPREIPESDTIRHLYVIRLNTDRLAAGRKTIYEALQAENIGVNVHYIPVYRLPYYECLGYRKGLCPNAEELYESSLTLPLFYAMTDEDARDVVRAVKKVIGYYRR
jgi:dTDP-4-amino-4,6-dideoxygalactose transaminase